jgi:Lrp/AsnC family leucine-responsive transcriptional regulator
VLQADGRISLADLSAKVGLSPSPCLRRIRILERDGIIARYVAVLDQGKVGLPVSVFVSIKLESQREQALERFNKAIAKWPEVLECYLMTGPRDYLLRIVVADLSAYDRFLKQKLTKDDGIASIDRVALEQVKYSHVLPIVGKRSRRQQNLMACRRQVGHSGPGCGWRGRPGLDADRR